MPRSDSPRLIRFGIAMRPFGLLLAFSLMVLAAFGPARTNNIVSLQKGTNVAGLDRTHRWKIAYNSESGTYVPPGGNVLWGKTIPEPKNRNKVVAITFDDGPHPRYTPGLVAELSALNIPATFFVVGKQVDLFPNLVQLEVSSGFTVGNHSYSHCTLTKLSTINALTEFRACNSAIHHACGLWPTFCRPPGGDASLDTVREAAANGLTTVMWTDDPGDYRIYSIKEVADRTIAGLSDHGIILLHDGGPVTLQALPLIVKEARAKGYTFVPLTEIPSTRM